MNVDATQKYRPFPPIQLPDRQWPSRTLTQAPIWCSSDLRDGNQALIEPMDRDRKLRFFELLVRMGFKQIEVAFPSASRTDFDFVRDLIEDGRIPDDVAIQVLTQSREELIRRTFDSLRGAKRAIPHLYNATAPIFREVVFGLDRAGLIELARHGAQLFAECAAEQPDTEWQFGDSPETFCFTQMGFPGPYSTSGNRRRSARRSSICRRPSKWRHPMSTPTRSSGSAAIFRAGMP